MGRGDLSDAEWELIGPLLPSERGPWARPAGDNGASSTVCFTSCGLAVRGETCTSGTASGTRSMFGSGAWPNRGLGYSPANAGRPEADRRLAHMIDSASVRGPFDEAQDRHVSAVGGEGEACRERSWSIPPRSNARRESARSRSGVLRRAARRSSAVRVFSTAKSRAARR